MDIKFNRINYFQVGLSSKNCMKVLPRNSKEPLNKIITADDKGVLQVTSVKKKQSNPIFKTVATSPIICIELGGKLGQERNIIFAALANGRVLGITKKGKQFLDLDTEMSEPIKSMHIEETDLLVAGEYTLRHFNNCVEVHFFLCPDKINDVICLAPNKFNMAIIPILACADRTLKILNGSDITGELSLSSVPNVLNLFDGSGGPKGDLVLYGTTDGKFGLTQINGSSQSLLWEHANLNNPTKGVIGLMTFDLENVSGSRDLIVGYENGGLVEVYGLEGDEGYDGLRLKGSHNVNESILSISCGHFSNEDFCEILCLTFSGWVVGLTSEPPNNNLPTTTLNTKQPNLKELSDHEIQVGILKKEIESLEKQIETEKEKYHNNSQRADLISQGQEVEVKVTFKLSTDEGSYDLSLETLVPIEFVMLQCDVPIDLIDNEKNSAIASFTPCVLEEGNSLLVTFRCQANTTKLDLKVIPIEGHQGQLRAYVVPRLQPKVCQVKELSIKPLCMHCRRSYGRSLRGGEDDDDDAKNRAINRLKLTGNISISDIHNWMVSCFWEIPDKIPSEENASFTFVSSILGTFVSFSYRKNSIEFTSNNLSTLSILKEFCSKEATRCGIKLDISIETNDDSVIGVLESITPKVDQLILVAKKVQLIEGLRELETQEGGANCMTEDFKKVLLEADELLVQHKQQHRKLERFYSMIVDLYVTWFKFKGQSVKDKLPRLREVIKKHDLNLLIRFFRDSQ